MAASISHVAASNSHVGASFQLAHAFDKMKSRRHKRRGLQGFPSHVGASFQLAHAFDKMEILSPQERWVRVCPCGCEFSTCTSPTRWKSCRHKRYRHLILNWFRTGGNDLIGRRRGIQRQGETLTQSTLELTVSTAESVRGWPGPKSRRCSGTDPP